MRCLAWVCLCHILLIAIDNVSRSSFSMLRIRRRVDVKSSESSPQSTLFLHLSNVTYIAKLVPLICSFASILRHKHISSSLTADNEYQSLIKKHRKTWHIIDYQYIKQHFSDQAGLFTEEVHSCQQSLHNPLADYRSGPLDRFGHPSMQGNKLQVFFDSLLSQSIRLLPLGTCCWKI